MVCFKEILPYMNRITAIIGKRSSGKSFAISKLIGEGRGVTVLVETEHDMIHHQTHSRCPMSAVIRLEVPTGMHAKSETLVAITESTTTLVLDNVIFYQEDPMLDDAFEWVGKDQNRKLIITVGHPLALGRRLDQIQQIKWLSVYPKTNLSLDIFASKKLECV